MELCSHRTTRTLMSAKFLVFIVLCLVLCVKIPLFPRDPERMRATVKVFISILFQDKNLLLKCKNYKVYAAVLLAIFSYFTCSNQSLFVHPPSCIFDFILSTILMCLFCGILPFLSLSPLISKCSTTVLLPPYTTQLVFNHSLTSTHTVIYLNTKFEFRSTLKSHCLYVCTWLHHFTLE